MTYDCDLGSELRSQKLHISLSAKHTFSHLSFPVLFFFSKSSFLTSQLKEFPHSPPPLCCYGWSQQTHLVVSSVSVLRSTYRTVLSIFKMHSYIKVKVLNSWQDMKYHSYSSDMTFAWLVALEDTCRRYSHCCYGAHAFKSPTEVNLAPL